MIVLTMEPVSKIHSTVTPPMPIVTAGQFPTNEPFICRSPPIVRLATTGSSRLNPWKVWTVLFKMSFLMTHVAGLLFLSLLKLLDFKSKVCHLVSHLSHAFCKIILFCSFRVHSEVLFLTLSLTSVWSLILISG